jgi:hypothetical protein
LDSCTNSYKIFLRGFGIESLWPHSAQKNPFGSDFMSVSSYWYCCLLGESSPFYLPDETIVFGVVQTNKWYKGYLALASEVDETTLKNYKNSFKPQTPLTTVDLTEWQDPVAKALNSIHAFPMLSRPPHQHPFGYRYTLDFSSLGCQGYFKIMGRSNTPLDQLYEQLLETIRYFAQFYDTPKIKVMANALARRD